MAPTYGLRLYRVLHRTSTYAVNAHIDLQKNSSTHYVGFFTTVFITVSDIIIKYPIENVNIFLQKQGQSI